MKEKIQALQIKYRRLAAAFRVGFKFGRAKICDKITSELDRLAIEIQQQEAKFTAAVSTVYGIALTLEGIGINAGKTQTVLVMTDEVTSEAEAIGLAVNAALQANPSFAIRAFSTGAIHKFSKPQQSTVTDQAEPV